MVAQQIEERAISGDRQSVEAPIDRRSDERFWGVGRAVPSAPLAGGGAFPVPVCALWPGALGTARPTFAHSSKARLTSTAMTGSLYSVDQRRPVALIISSETFCPAAANRFCEGFSPTSICSASGTRFQVGNAAPGTMHAWAARPSPPTWRTAATLIREMERALRRPSLMKALRASAGSFGNRMPVSSSSGFACV